MSRNRWSYLKDLAIHPLTYYCSYGRLKQTGSNSKTALQKRSKNDLMKMVLKSRFHIYLYTAAWQPNRSRSISFKTKPIHQRNKSRRNPDEEYQTYYHNGIDRVGGHIYRSKCRCCRNKIPILVFGNVEIIADIYIALSWRHLRLVTQWLFQI